MISAVFIFQSSIAFFDYMRGNAKIFLDETVTFYESTYP
jgi:hypothetical protein